MSGKRVLDSLAAGWLYLFPHRAERDETFQLEIYRLGRRSLYIIACVFLGLIVFVYPLLPVFPIVDVSPEVAAEHLVVAAALIGILFLLARSPIGLRYGRELALLLTFVGTALAVHFDVTVAATIDQAERFVFADCIGALIVAVVVVPALPLQMFVLGLAVAGTAIHAVGYSGWITPPPGHSLMPLTFMLVSEAILCAILSAVNYRRFYSTHKSHRSIMDAQRNLLLSESAASVGRLSAALSHELNNPLGSLKSSLATLKDLRRKLAAAPPEQRPRLNRLAAQLDANADQALGRLERIVSHMQRFTNLDRAAEREFSLAALIEDVVSLAAPDDRARIRLELDPALRLYSKPQLLGAVLSSLIQHSLEQSPPATPVLVRSGAPNSPVRILIRDHRPALSASVLSALFDPRFQVEGGRVTTGNWVWFNSRQILRELGGDLTVVSHEPETLTTLALPRRLPKTASRPASGI